MENKKRKHHYVFQSYLNNWARDRKVFCLRADKIFPSATINIAQERDFYAIKSLNKDEKRFYELFISRKSEEIKNLLNIHMKFLLGTIERAKILEEKILVLEKEFEEWCKIPDCVKKIILEEEKSIELDINNRLEDYHSKIESEGMKYIRLLEEENCEFYYTEKFEMKDNIERFSFLNFVITQYFRTKASRIRFVSTLTPCLNHPSWSKLKIPKENINLENLAEHFLWYVQTHVLNTFRVNKTHLTILINKTKIPFITSDQPVINIYANYQKLNDEVSDLEFYYPLSPKIAITVNDKNLKNKIELTANEVERYNNAMIKASNEYIFANEDIILNNLKKK